MKEIEQILVDGQGWFYSKDGVIERYGVNGEMAIVDWYKQTLSNGIEKHFNGRFIVEIDYREERVK